MATPGAQGATGGDVVESRGPQCEDLPSADRASSRQAPRGDLRPIPGACMRHARAGGALPSASTSERFVVDPQDPSESAPPKRLNAFQILGAVLSAAGGVRGISKRGSSVADASTGAILGAILIFCAVLGLGLYAFVHAVKSSVAG